MPETEARQYLCDRSATAPTGVEYYAVVFRFRTEGGGVLGLLWGREGNKWRIMSYQPLNQ